MNPELKGMFESVDNKSVEGFLSYLADDVVFRFGNAPEIAGKEDVRAGIERFFSQIVSLEHVLKGVWNEGETTILQFDTYYTKQDGVIVGVPCCVVVRFNAERLINDYRIHIDLSPLYTSTPDRYLIRASAPSSMHL
ncbi:nuclear transport factor 2 family protein [Pseudomonas sp. R5(2019)]|uniref:nuclear transport factor 2 family protein n=1 Tax=Pseudomonas sp. R5(2019) TaxID=2697566 RepID=UPI001412EA71|nr:nuclear transport factor 2 family protein [Pseudomonas sp. R5(2019)]NBA93647.1 nuclear transport factor 2 family protein [Pseudomonas sp. R5(2019)]